MVQQFWSAYSFFEASRLSLDQQMFQLVKFSEFDKEDFSTTLF